MRVRAQKCPARANPHGDVPHQAARWGTARCSTACSRGGRPASRRSCAQLQPMVEILSSALLLCFLLLASLFALLHHRDLVNRHGVIGFVELSRNLYVMALMAFHGIGIGDIPALLVLVVDEYGLAIFVFDPAGKVHVLALFGCLSFFFLSFARVLTRCR